MTSSSLRKIHRGIHLIQYAFADYKRQFAVVGLLGLLGGLFGGIGVGAVIPLFSLLTDDPLVESNLITNLIQETFSLFSLPLTLVTLLGFILVLFTAKAVVQFLANYIAAKTAAEYEERERKKLFQKTLKARWEHLLEHKAGYLERILLNDLIESSSAFTNVSTAILLGANFLMYGIVAFSISPMVTLLTIAFGGVLFLLFKPIFYKTRILSAQRAQTQKDAGHLVGQHIIGAKIVKASAVEPAVAQQGGFLFAVLRTIKTKLALYQYASSHFLEPVGFLFIAIVLIFAHQTPGFAIASFAAVIYLIQKMFAFIQQAQSSLTNASRIVPFIQATTSYSRTVTDAREQRGGQKPFHFQTNLQLENVSFSYEPDRPILADITLAIPKGTMVGIIGPSGSGKTTLIDLILRLLMPNSGALLLDETPAEHIALSEWRNHIGYVPQETFLLNDTVGNNIRFYDTSLTRDNIIAAAQAANIYEAIQTFPHQLDTVVGERGVKLSGGQRQRIALARALARKPQILVLDEATSELDSKSEHLIQQALEELRGDTTIIVVAHRLSTIRSSDTILILESGNIIERGDPATLLAKQDSHFYQMYNLRD